MGYMESKKYIWIWYTEQRYWEGSIQLQLMDHYKIMHKAWRDIHIVIVL